MCKNLSFFYCHVHRVSMSVWLSPQVALAGTQIWWTTEVNLAFNRLEEGYENALKDYYKKQVCTSFLEPSTHTYTCTVFPRIDARVFISFATPWTRHLNEAGIYLLPVFLAHAHPHYVAHAKVEIRVTVWQAKRATGTLNSL